MRYIVGVSFYEWLVELLGSGVRKRAAHGVVRCVLLRLLVVRGALAGAEWGASRAWRVACAVERMAARARDATCRRAY
jgi:hypothetical protein